MTHQDVERRTIRKVSMRLLPLIAILYFVASLDRTNISFAALTMNAQLHLSAYIFGWGAGIFSITYCLFEIPSNYALVKVGARRWIARIMITWGLASGAMALAQGPISFLTLRLLLGAAEAGFVPGILLYITFWFPAPLRARAIAIFLLAAPISNAISALLSAPILAMDGFLGVHGWQWMFIIEAVPAIVLAFVVLAMLTDKPKFANWLEPDEKAWLQGTLDAEKPVVASPNVGFWQILRTPQVLLLAFAYCGRNVGMFGIAFFLPQIVKTLGLGNSQVGLVTSIPYIIATVGMWLWARSSDRHDERRWHMTVSLLLAAVGLGMAGMFSHSMWALVGISFAAIGMFACSPCLYPQLNKFLNAGAMAGAIAIVNSIGNLGAFLGPYGIGWIKDSTGSFEDALYFMAAASLLAALLAYLCKPPVRAPADSASATAPAQELIC